VGDATIISQIISALSALRRTLWDLRHAEFHQLAALYRR
jgi:hypothetical protein